MPTLTRPLRGSLVMTSGSVMNGPASSGHVVSTGSLVRSGLRMTTSCTLPSRTIFGIALASGASRERAASFPTSDPPGGAKSMSWRTRAPTSSRLVAPSAIAMRRSRAELIGQHRETRTLDVGEEQRRAAGFDDAIGDLADLELRIDARLDDVQFAGAAQRVDEMRAATRNGMASLTYALEPRREPS